MNNTTFLNGIARVLNCPKVHIAATGLVSTWFAVRFAAEGLPPTQRASLWIAFVGAVAIQLREVINAWTEEDVARVNATAVAPSSNTPPAAQSPQAGPAALSAPASLPPLARSSAMPARTRLPLILIASALFALLSTGGCTQCPELAIYRQGLHAVDEPLYQAHLLLMDDAVKANLRTEADRQVIQKGIEAARGMYK